MGVGALTLGPVPVPTSDRSDPAEAVVGFLADQAEPGVLVNAMSAVRMLWVQSVIFR